MAKFARLKDAGATLVIRGREPIVGSISEDAYNKLVESHPEVANQFEVYEETPVKTSSGKASKES